MKKLFYLLILLYLFSYTITYGYSNTSRGIDEKITFNKNKRLIKVKFIINKNYNKKEIVLVPHIFELVNDSLINTDINKLDIRININNLSKYKYKYKRQTLKIMPDDLNRYTKYIHDTGLVSNNSKIYREYYFNRSYNDAIKSLFKKEFSCNLLDENMINSKLKDNGYTSLDSYYLDYYNNKYNSSYDSIYDFDQYILKDIFDGEVCDVSESSDKLIKLGYDYFYSNAIIVKFNNKKYNFLDFKDDFKSNYYLSILKNTRYYTKSFKTYKLYGYLEFKLKKY